MQTQTHGHDAKQALRDALRMHVAGTWRRGAAAMPRRMSPRTRRAWCSGVCVWAWALGLARAAGAALLPPGEPLETQGLSKSPGEPVLLGHTRRPCAALPSRPRARAHRGCARTTPLKPQTAARGA